MFNTLALSQCGHQLGQCGQQDVRQEYACRLAGRNMVQTSSLSSVLKQIGIKLLCSFTCPSHIRVPKLFIEQVDQLVKGVTTESVVLTRVQAIRQVASYKHH
jgi:hypothetical protein